VPETWQNRKEGLFFSWLLGLRLPRSEQRGGDDLWRTCFLSIRRERIGRFTELN